MTEASEWGPGVRSMHASADSVSKGLLASRPRPGPDLGQGLYVSYWIAPRRPNLAGLVFLPLLAGDQTAGSFGLEVVAPGNRIVWQDAVPLGQVVSNRSLRFDFPAIPDSDQGVYELRVFTRGVRGAVRVLEHRLLAHVFGMRRWRVRPLCGMVFGRRCSERPADGQLPERRDPWASRLSPELAALVGSPSFEGHYWTSGWQTANVQLTTDLKIGDSLLDVGCGAGRLAYGLHGWFGGRYVGVDIVPGAIEYCRQQFPRFEFRHMNVHSDLYNSDGAVETSGMTIPVEDSSFDVAVLMSVYTHLLPDRAARMTAEISRALKPSGRCLATFFILDDMRPAPQPSLRHELTPFCRVERPEAPEHAVGYTRSFVENMFARHGLRVAGFYRGTWTGSDGLGLQDQILFTKAPVAATPSTDTE